MGADTFQLGDFDSGVRVRFENGPGGPMTVLYDDGEAQTHPRSG
jgi:hypothetical protein